MPFGKRKALGESAAVHREAQRIGHGQAGHEISPAKLFARHAGLGRCLVDQPFEDVDHFGETGPARHTLRRGVGQHRPDMQCDRRNGIDRAGKMNELPGLHAARDIAEPGAGIRCARYAEREEAPFPVQGEFGLGALSAGLVVAQEDLRPRRRPANRTAQPARGPEQQHMLGIGEVLDAEPSADIFRDETHPFRLDAQAHRHMIAIDVQVLAGEPERIAPVGRIVERASAARLHRVDDHAMVQQRDSDPVGGARKGLLDSGRVPGPPIDTGPLRFRLQRLIDDAHPVRRIQRLVRRGPGHERDRLARIACNVPRQQGLRLPVEGFARLHVRGLVGPQALKVRNIRRREDFDPVAFHRPDPGMGMRAAQERRPARSRNFDVVQIAAPPGDEPGILAPACHVPRSRFRAIVAALRGESPMAELWELSAEEAVRRLTAGEVSPLELVDASIGRIEDVDGAVNALPLHRFDRARNGEAAAGHSARRPGPARRPADRHQGPDRRRGPAHHLWLPALCRQCRGQVRSAGDAAGSPWRRCRRQVELAGNGHDAGDDEPGVRPHAQSLELGNDAGRLVGRRVCGAGGWRSIARTRLGHRRQPAHPGSFRRRLRPAPEPRTGAAHPFPPLLQPDVGAGSDGALGWAISRFSSTPCRATWQAIP